MKFATHPLLAVFALVVFGLFPHWTHSSPHSSSTSTKPSFSSQILSYTAKMITITSACATLCSCPSIALASPTESRAVPVIKEPSAPAQEVPSKSSKPQLGISSDDSVDRVLTLGAYLDELEYSVISSSWDKVLIYAYTFAEQDVSFARVIDALFPSQDALDAATRAALSFEAQQMFSAIDSLLEAAHNKDTAVAQRAVTKLALNYDHFLKAGSLYPTYDPITSTEIFFVGTPLDSLRYDRNPPQSLDRVLVLRGPDMGKTGSVLLLEEDNAFAFVKLDKNGRAYSEVKAVRVRNLGRLMDQETLSLRRPPSGQSGGNINKLRTLR